MSDVDKQWNFSYDSFSLAINETILSLVVTMTNNDKAWMTPLTKSLINDRWTAFRQKNWKRYDYLKLKVKEEILHAKRILAEKLAAASPCGQ